MSILSWDDFEDDSQKPTAPEHKSASLDSQKTVNTQMVSNAEQSSPSMAAAQPVGASANRATNPTDSLARASAALDHLRSEERRVGKECCPRCRSRWSPYH